MFQRIFVPLDGSARAEKAIPVAARLAHVAGGTVTLARVIVPPANAARHEANILANESRLAQAAEFIEAKEYLDEVVEIYADKLAGVDLVTEVAPGDIPSTLISLAGMEQSDLIVMCSRGESLLKRWIFGSAAQATVRHSALPVLVLNEHGDISLFENLSRPLRLLVTLDGSSSSEAILEPACQLLAMFPASVPHELHLLRIVVEPAAIGRFRSGAHITDALQKEERHAAGHYLQAIAQRLSTSNSTASSFAITTSVIINSDVAGTVLREAEEATRPDAEGYDLIALATHGRTGIKRAMLGSVTEHVFGATSLPLLTVCPTPSKLDEKHTDSHAKHEMVEEPLQSWVGLL